MENKNFIIDCRIKEHNGKHYITVEELKSVEVNNLIEILTIKYSKKGLFGKIKKAFEIAGMKLEDGLK